MKSALTVRGTNWQQEEYETASRDAGKRARQLRKLGYRVVVSSPSIQVTPVGLVKLTMLTIMNADENVPQIEEYQFNG